MTAHFKHLKISQYSYKLLQSKGAEFRLFTADITAQQASGWLAKAELPLLSDLPMTVCIYSLLPPAVVQTAGLRSSTEHP